MTIKVATSQGILDFLDDQAREDIQQMPEHLDEMLGYELDELEKDPAFVAALQDVRVTPSLLRANIDFVREYAKERWEELSNDIDLDYAPIDKFIDEFEEGWTETVINAIDSHAAADGITEARRDDMINTLTEDPYVFWAFLCQNDWSCDWVDDIMKVLDGTSITPEDLNMDARGDGGTMAYMAAEGKAIDEILSTVMTDYVTEWLAEDAEKFRDPRQLTLHNRFSRRTSMASKAKVLYLRRELGYAEKALRRFAARPMSDNRTITITVPTTKVCKMFDLPLPDELVERAEEASSYEEVSDESVVDHIGASVDDDTGEVVDENNRLIPQEALNELSFALQTAVSFGYEKYYWEELASAIESALSEFSNFRYDYVIDMEAFSGVAKGIVSVEVDHDAVTITAAPDLLDIINTMIEGLGMSVPEVPSRDLSASEAKQEISNTLPYLGYYWEIYGGSSPKLSTDFSPDYDQAHWKSEVQEIAARYGLRLRAW